MRRVIFILFIYIVGIGVPQGVYADDDPDLLFSDNEGTDIREEFFSSFEEGLPVTFRSINFGFDRGELEHENFWLGTTKKIELESNPYFVTRTYKTKEKEEVFRYLKFRYKDGNLFFNGSIFGGSDHASGVRIPFGVRSQFRTYELENDSVLLVVVPKLEKFTERKALMMCLASYRGKVGFERDGSMIKNKVEPRAISHFLGFTFDAEVDSSGKLMTGTKKALGKAYAIVSPEFFQHSVRVDELYMRNPSVDSSLVIRTDNYNNAELVPLYGKGLTAEIAGVLEFNTFNERKYTHTVHRIMRVDILDNIDQIIDMLEDEGKRDMAAYLEDKPHCVLYSEFVVTGNLYSYEEIPEAIRMSDKEEKKFSK